MIYLIDDNRRQQQEEYNSFFLKEKSYHLFFEAIYKIKQSDNLNFLKKAKCILIHQSFPDFNESAMAIEGSTTIYENILEISNSNQIPIVIFSNGAHNIIFSKTNITAINKQLFYQNLEDFIIHYSKTKQIIFEILIYGKNYLYKELSLIFNEIALMVRMKSDTNENKNLYDLSRLFSEKSNSDVTIVNNKLEQLSFDKLELDYLPKLTKILNSMLKYGRNIYS